MGKKSNRKAKRRREASNEYDYEPMRLRQFAKPAAFIAGLYIVSFGIGTCGMSRWEHQGSLQPHPWFILLGVALISYAIWQHARGG